MCQSKLTELFPELSEFSLPKQYSRISNPPVSQLWISSIFLFGGRGAKGEAFEEGAGSGLMENRGSGGRGDCPRRR